jgi:hypothetical protein
VGPGASANQPSPGGFAVIVRLTVTLAALVVFASCGGDGVIDPGTGPPNGNSPTLTSLESTIFTPKCALPGCHAAPFPEQGMDLSRGNVYVYTVGVDSVELSPYKRIAPANSADSYLYMKIAGDPRIIGDRMPLGGMLTAAEIDAVRTWIDAGAKND